jgi:hypothetical protein
VKWQVRFACESGDRSAQDRFRGQAQAGDVDVAPVNLIFARA